MAGIVRATLQIQVGTAHITPDRCPAEGKDAPLKADPSPLHCWTTTDLWGSDYCPYLLHIARAHRTTSRYADPMHAVDERHSADSVVGRVACMCQLQRGENTTPGG